jgi:hypothetical protein
LAVLAAFEPISVAEMNGATLMSRVDTKYLLGAAQLPMLLARLVDDYVVLEIAGVRLNHYRNLYFDTPDLRFYLSHHMNRGDRFKVRSRSYVDTGRAFLEVKHKLSKGRMLKRRIETDALLTRLTPEARAWVDRQAPVDPTCLEPTLWTEYSRLTLVRRDRPERATFDVGLHCDAGDDELVLDGLAVAEVKQAGPSRDSPLMRQLRELGIRPTPFSKYCVGIAHLYPELKHNRFKPILRHVDAIMRGANHAN